MSKLKKFLIVFLSFFPLTASAIVPWLIAAGVATIAGVSIWRSTAPVNMNDALSFFSSCWTCNMFSSIMTTMSNILPRIYSEIGAVVIPMAAILLAIYFLWTIASGFLNAKVDKAWTTAANFSRQLIRLIIVCALLVFPLPRLISTTIIEPVFSIGLSINHVVGDSDTYNECMIATTLMDKNSDSLSGAANGVPNGAFPAKLRHGLTCQIANVHQLTGFGMTVGWTMLNMAFDYEYMHKIMWEIPIFPNVPIFFAGLLILALYFTSILPIVLYFLEIFINLALDFVMLPLMLLSWLFSGWKIFPNGGRTIKKMIDDVINGAVGIAMMSVFLMFGIMFLDAIIGNVGDISRIESAIANNDSNILMDGLMLQDSSLISLIMMGAFFAMFMTSIPTLIKTLFNVTVSDKFYKTAKSDFDKTRATLGKWWKSIKK